MILALVRHGKTHFNANGFVQGRVNNHLNDEGKAQSIALAKRLIKDRLFFDQFASSPLSRALETAFIIRNEMNSTKPIHICPRFVERDFAALDGTPIEEAMPLVRIKNYEAPGYETDHMMIQRISRAAIKLEHRFLEQKVLLVAHSHVIKALLIYCHPQEYTFKDFIGHTDVFYFEIKDQNIRFMNRESA